MACNSCAKPFTLLRKEKGCPGCGFSYCSKCLSNKLFLKKHKSEVKVCSKCKRTAGTDTEEKKYVQPPDAYLKRIGAMSNTASNSQDSDNKTNDTDEEIRKRLLILKANRVEDRKGTTDDEISKRLEIIKGPQPTTSDAELQQRLANLRGIPNIGIQSKPMLYAPDTRTEEEQANDLMKQYLEQTNIDTLYKDGFDKQISDIEARVQKLRGVSGPSDDTSNKTPTKKEDAESEDEETIIKRIIEKAKADSALPDEDAMPSPTNDELPFCEICNEDATLRCLGCRYLFCKRCFIEHKDDDDGCNRYEPYNPSKQS